MDAGVPDAHGRGMTAGVAGDSGGDAGEQKRPATGMTG